MSTNLRASLRRIYGNDIRAQEGRYYAALTAFRQRFGPGPVEIYRVPGRVNLIGEHTDYQQGYVLPVALDKDLVFVVRRRSDAHVALENMELGFTPRHFTISDEIPSGPKGDWGNYARGAAQMLSRAAQQPLQGADVLLSSAPPHGVPRGAGLSSSSALTVGIALILAQGNGLGHSPAELAWLSGEAEWYVGTRGGIMDQFIALLGQKDHALFLDCRAVSQGEGIPRFRTQQVPLPGGFQFLVVDSKVRHQNVRSDFNVRVAEGRMGVALLQRRYPQITHLRDLEAYDWREIEPLLPQALGWDDLADLGIQLHHLIDVELPRQAAPFQVRARCRHVVSENARVRESVAALNQGEVARFADLTNQAHKSVSHDYGASCPELELLVRLARGVQGVLAARMTGAGWGGCIVALAEQGCERAFAAHLRPRYHQETGLWPDVFACRASQGAGLVAHVATL